MIKFPSLQFDKKTAHENIATGLKVLAIAWRVRKSGVIAYFIAALAEIAASILTIYASAQLANLLARYIAGKPTGEIWFWLWVDIAAAATIALAFWGMQFSKRLIYFRVSSWATRTFMGAVCNIDIDDFYDEKVRNQINKAQNGYTWQISNLIDSCLELIYGVLRFMAIAFVVAQITWWLIPIIAIFLVPTLLTENRLAKVQWFVWDTKGDDRHIFWGIEWLIRQAKSQMELRSSQARNYLLHKIEVMDKNFYRTQEREYRKLTKISAPSKLLEVVGTAVGSIVLLRQFLGGQILLDRYLFLSGALLRVGGALNAIFGTLNRMQEPLLFAKNFFEFAANKPTIVDKPDAIQLPKVSAPQIVFENVSFTYPRQQQPVFTNLNLTINAGEHIALVGENGAGKSTLIKLLLRFYKPTDGRILIDGHDIQDIAIETWYAQLATLFQEFNMYPFPIDENIYIANPETKEDKKRLKEAAKFSDVDAMVKDYKHGWETVLNSSFKKGIEPSGGQWQRVALARAFYRHANVLILDEPTAAIDAKAEYDIFNNIFDHYKNKTAIIVSHRFSTVRRAHRILVVDDGKIIEQGSHSELMAQNGLYYELFTKQAEGYRD